MNVSQNFWVKDHRQIYLIGNPMIWWLSTAAVAGYVAVRGFLILRAQRGYRDFESSEEFLLFSVTCMSI
jgi:dolichyl-phosphate-mannose-protein mannosyltransferase